MNQSLRRFQTRRDPLTNEQLQQFAPSIFGAARDTDRTSARFQLFPTVRVIEALRKEGFLPVAAMQTNVRIIERRAFCRHLVVFRHRDHQIGTGLRVGETIPEIVLVNAHDGTASYQLHAGLFRLVCANGLIVADGTLAAVRVSHHAKRDIVGDVIDATYEIVEDMPAVMNQVETWRGTPLTTEQQLAYGTAALQLRYDADAAPITPTQLVAPRRLQDRQRDLWTTFNVVQENILRGGQRGQPKNGRRTSTRAVAAVTETVRLNKALWTLTQEMAQLIGAAGPAELEQAA